MALLWSLIVDEIRENGDSLLFAFLHHIHRQSPCILRLFLQRLVIKYLDLAPQNAPKRTISRSKKIKNYLGRGHCSSGGEGYLFPHPVHPTLSSLELTPKCNVLEPPMKTNSITNIIRQRCKI